MKRKYIVVTGYGNQMVVKKSLGSGVLKLQQETEIRVSD